MVIISIIGILICAVWIALAAFHGMFWRPLVTEPIQCPSGDLSVDIVVPARDEAASLWLCLPFLLRQTYQGPWRIILIDDNSSDGTADIALKIAKDLGKGEKLHVEKAPALEARWRSGKVAAMNVGVALSRADMILFTDADIMHAPDSLMNLVACAESRGFDLVSRMVLLRCVSFAEKFLIPAFVFFFAMLYPFRKVNDPTQKIAAAAGGVMLIRRPLLDKFGGLSAIKSALIDDCALAKVAKSYGARINLELSRDIKSIRPYPHIPDIWKMVARSAYTQLDHSPFILLGTLIGLFMLFAYPLILFLYVPTVIGAVAGLFAWAVMTAIYMPMVRFYGLPWIWAFTLPLAAILYGAATFDSARLFYKGRGGQWKGRAQA